MRSLARILPDHELAAWLGRASILTPTRRNYTRALVASLRHTHGIGAYSEEHRDEEGWLSLEEAAALIDVSPRTLRRAAKRSDIRGVQPLPNGPWIFARTDLETESAKRVTANARGRRDHGDAGPSSDQRSLDILDR